MMKKQGGQTFENKSGFTLTPKIFGVTLQSKGGFTFIELMVVVAIIVILATAIWTAIGAARKKARLNAATTSARSVLPVIVACNDAGGQIGFPEGSEDGSKPICDKIDNAFWPKLQGDYVYDSGSTNFTENCKFQITTSDRISPIVCECAKQSCQ